MWWLAMVPLGLLATLVAVVAVVVVILAATGVAVPWFFFGFILWAVLAVRRGPHHGLSSRRAGQRWPETTRPAQRAARSPLCPRSTVRSWALAPHGSDLPSDVQATVDRIRRKVEVLVAYAPSFPPYSADLHIVRQTAADYLPRTIEAYLALPPTSRDRVATENGKTALQELRDQLELLELKLNSIAERLERQDVDRLLANRRFLEERLQHSRE